MKKVFIAGGIRFGENRVLARYGFELVEEIGQANLVVFTGGVDINPVLYGDKIKHYRTQAPHNDRDQSESAIFVQAVSLGIPILGICRGAQLVCCLSGGRLHQDCSDHHTSHKVRDVETGEIFLSNSVHHQMMVLPEDAVLKAVAFHKSNVAQTNLEQTGFAYVDMVETPEIAIIPRIKAVLVQGHPEFDSTEAKLTRFREYVFGLVNEFQEVEATTPLVEAN